MAVQTQDAVLPGLCVKTTLRLGSELYSVSPSMGQTISEQLALMKEESMSILKEFITKHNVANEVPDEVVESSSEEEDEIPEKPQIKSKKTKLT